MAWNANSNFDPYSQILIRIPAETFNGSHSETILFTLQCKEPDVCIPASANDIKWTNDVALKLSNLAVNNQYSVFASAQGQGY
jgi:hypothetical protein